MPPSTQLEQTSRGDEETASSADRRDPSGSGVAMFSTDSAAPHAEQTIASTGGGNEADNAGESEAAAEGEARRAGPFGGLDPREAGRRSAEVRRQRREAEAEREQREAEQTLSALDDRGSDLAIVARLRRDAAAGDVRAARELRAWLDSIRSADPLEDWQALEPVRRDLFEAWLVDVERAEQGAAASPRAEQL